MVLDSQVQEKSQWHGEMNSTGYLRSFLYTYKPSIHAQIMLCKTRPGSNVLRSSIVPMAHILTPTDHLCIENEGGTDLVGGLVELLGIKGSSETEGNTGAKENVVGDGGDTTVIDLGLNIICQ